MLLLRSELELGGAKCLLQNDAIFRVSLFFELPWRFSGVLPQGRVSSVKCTSAGSPDYEHTE